MAKSQYTDSITGDILVDARVVDGKIYNFGNYRKMISKSITTSDIVFSDGKYSTNSIRLYNNKTTTAARNSDFTLNLSSLSGSYTISFWSKSTLPSTIKSGSEVGIYNFFQCAQYDKNWSRLSHYNVKTSALYKSGSYIYGPYHEITIGGTNINNGTTSNIESLGNWYHYAITVNNGTIKVYRNGSQTLTNTHDYLKKQSGSVYNNISMTQYNNTGDIGTIWFQFDDFVVINNQILWTGNFTVPNYLLTGDHDLPKKIRNKFILHPSMKYKGDYFDKAYLY